MGTLSIDKDIIKNFNKTNEYVFFGESNLIDKIQCVFEKDIKSCFIIDNDKNKLGNLHNGLIIKNIEAIEELDKNNRIIITAATAKAQFEIVEQLKEQQYNIGENVILASDFIRLWKWNYEKKIAINYVEQMITSRCTLNCKHCGLYIPLFEEKKDREYEDIISDLDNLFNTIDYVAEFRILGGEPLIHDKLSNILEFITRKYRKYIGILAIVTNGTVKPSSQVLQLCKEYQIVFHISDYTKNLEHLRDKQMDLVKSLEKEGIEYHISTSFTWVDVGNPKVKQICTKEDVIERFEQCKMPCRSLLNKRLYFCGTMASAVLANIYVEKEEDSLDLKQTSELELIERFKKVEAFELGFNKKGYIDYCYYCNGFGNNDRLVPAAIQA